MAKPVVVDGSTGRCFRVCCVVLSSPVSRRLAVVALPFCHSDTSRQDRACFLQASPIAPLPLSLDPDPANLDCFSGLCLTYSCSGDLHRLPPFRGLYRTVSPERFNIKPSPDGYVRTTRTLRPITEGAAYVRQLDAQLTSHRVPDMGDPVRTPC